MLANPLIHQWRITAAAAWRDGIAAFLPPPIAGVNKPPQVRTISLERDDEALLHLSQEGFLALSLAEMQAIQAYFRVPQRQQHRQAYGLGTDPTDVELEALAQTWSEHCKHKIFNSTIHYHDETRTRPQPSAVSSRAISCVPPRRLASGRLAAVGVSRQCRGDQIQRPVEPGDEGRDAQYPFGA